MILRDCLAWNIEMLTRHKIRTRSVPPSNTGNPDIYEITLKTGQKFNVLKSKFDAWNSLYTFTGEKEMRQKFLYNEEPGVMLDIGCCFGSWSLPALALGWQVHGFEPDTRWLNDLIESVKLNDFKREFYPIDLAVYSKSGAEIKDLGEIQNIETISIDDYVEWNHLTPDYIKIDVEGMEYHIILGAQKTLEKYHPKVFVENHLWSTKTMEYSIKEKMEKFGYIYQSAGYISDDVSYSFYCHPP